MLNGSMCCFRSSLPNVAEVSSSGVGALAHRTSLCPWISSFMFGICAVVRISYIAQEHAPSSSCLRILVVL